MTNNTIFDDVFRTMVEKMTYLVVPLINEVFHTVYPEDVKIVQLRNEHQLEDGEIITDSCLRIGDMLYHIECQSLDDETMAVRMVEYDFAIALEHRKKVDGILRTIFEKRKKDTGFSGGRVNPSGFSDVCISGSNCESGALYKR